MPRSATSARLRLVAIVVLGLVPAIALLLSLAPVVEEGAFHRTLTLLAVVAALAATVAWFAGERYLLRPLRALRHATDRMAAGDLSARFAAQVCPPELAKLGACFNAMA